MKRTFGENLRKLRKDRGLTQAKLAQVVNIPMSTIRNWEQGRFIPEVNTLCNLATYFDCSIDFLLGRSDCTTVSNQLISEEIGLSDNAIEALKRLERALPEASHNILDAFIQTKYFAEYLECIHDYAYPPTEKDLEGYDVEFSDTWLDYISGIGTIQDVENKARVLKGMRAYQGAIRQQMLSVEAKMLDETLNIFNQNRDIQE